MIKTGIRVYYSKREKDVMFTHVADAGKANARYLANRVFTEEVLAELDKRGLDITTLKFSIKPKEVVGD